ncbi:bromodomain and WD repeat-containing protein 3 [Galendromus occidentalis]|uniref:Bromodomain and WD repeat-containing protein 3 n=1 Tax=Galendromus occidentalis TaxID=34638 RepID=A0AAJ7L628_9ACAR|nr:bromodomain and WD repeat-containing protein 3 [Galendromus occidentalis]
MNTGIARVAEQLADSELYYLIAKFLEGGPCKRAAQAIREEIDEHKLLSQRTDWIGNKHDITVQYMERLCPIESDYLLRLCENLCTALNTAVPTALAKAPRTLLGTGRHSALRTKESVVSRRPFFSTEPFMERRGQKILNPATTLCPSIALLTETRKLTSSRNLLGIAPVSMYSSSSLFRRIAGHLSAVYCVLYDHTGKFIFTGADDDLVKIWSAIDGRLVATLRGHASALTDLTLSPDNSMIASGSLDKTIRVWCLKTLRPVAVLIGHTSMVTSLKFCPSVLYDRSFLASTGNDGSLCFWEYDAKKKEFQKEPRRFTDRAKAGAQLLCQSFSPGGSLLATGSADHFVRIYQIFKPSGTLSCRREPERIAELAAHTDRVDSIQFANNDTRLISGSRDGTANIWTFKANRWTNITLKMTTNLEGTSRDDEGAHSELVKIKMKVNMVAWTKDDSNVLTTVSDHSVKIWNSCSGQLLRVLKGHEDDVYSLECHPTDRRILYTGGHDGRVIIWDMTAGKALKTFLNFFEGQGFGAMFDLKVSPDGLTFCATDSHGHLSLYGLGNGEAYAKVPDEQFFHTDYQPLIRDANQNVLDEQTQVAPHLMPAPFLVNIDLRPYPPNYQRLVPGRENCPDELLIPVEARDQNQEQDPNRRPNIDDMIQRLQDQQGNNARAGRAPPTPSSRGGMRREGEVEGVRQGGNWGQANNAMNVPRKKIVVPPLSAPEIERELNRTSILADFEMVDFHREKKREQLEASSAKAYGLRQNKDRSSLTNGSSRSRRGVVTLNDLHRSSGRALRSSAPIEDMEIDDDEFDEVGESDSDYEQDSPGRERTSTGRSRNRDTERNGARQNGHAAAASSSRGGTRSRRLVVREEAHSAPTSTSGTEEDEEDSEGSSQDDAEEDQRSDSEQNQDSTEAEDDQEQDDDEEEIEQAGPSSRRRPRELQEKFRPPDWLTDVMPRRTPYLPQVGDILMYFQQGHELYCEAVRRRRLYKLGKEHQFHWNKKLREQEKVRVLDVKFELLPPRLCCVKVECTDPGSPNSADAFWIRYHDCSDVIDFLVLHQIFQTARERDWKPGDRFRSIIEDQWWLGTIKTHEPIQPEFPDSMFQCFMVKWDNGEEERMSPWDFEPVDHTRLPVTQGSGVDITPGEREALQYVPSQEDFDTESRDAFRTRMMKGLDVIMTLSIAEPFLVPVDLNSYPAYATVVAYPMDLTTIRSRLDNNFYRRKEGIKFDVSYIGYNAEKFNESSSAIVKQARLLTRVLLQFINDVNSEDPLSIYQRLSSGDQTTRGDLSSDDSGGPGPSRKLYLNGYNDSKSPGKKSREEIRRPTTRTTSNWREQCATLVALLIQQEDSEPFRAPPDLEEFPDYAELIKTPMDLSTVSDKLTNGIYGTPEDFAKDMQIIFANSRTYNTDKRSRIYTMTLRLSAMFETHMHGIILDHKAAMKRSKTRKTYEEEEDSDEEKYSKRSHTRLQRSNPRRSKPSPAETNGHSSGSSQTHSSGSSSSFTKRRRPVETEEDEEVVTKTTSTRSGRVVRPTRFNDMVSMSDEEHEDRQRSTRTDTRSMASRKRKITTETEDEKEDLSSEEVRPRVLTTRSGRTVKRNRSSTSASTSSSAASNTSGNSPTTSTSDDSSLSPRKRSAATPAASASSNNRRTSNNERSRVQPRRIKVSTEEDEDDDEEDDDDDDEEEEEEAGADEEEEDDAASSEEITTEESPGAHDRRSTRARRSQTASRTTTRETSDDSTPPRRSSRQKKPVPSKRNVNNNVGSGALSERPVRAARSKRLLTLDEDSEDYDKDYEEIASSRPKRSRTRMSNGSNSNHFFD